MIVRQTASTVGWLIMSLKVTVPASFTNESGDGGGGGATDKSFNFLLAA
jgi:hypothetical protein